MSLIKWSNDLSINVQEIDDQHQKLVDMINSLHKAMNDGQSQQIIGKIIKNMVEYTESHFQLEENYFEQFNYDLRDEHKKEHDQFIEKAQKLQNDYFEGSIRIGIETMQFLKEWLVDHIMVSDKKFVQCFHENDIV
ncbi:MAG: bacteriohemerythrin [Spirochaetia bacterium]|nr:bacteriohemerythrin [Spirochaetia bacterium]